MRCFDRLCVYVCISELREEVKPETIELIKQQRLNYLVEGTLFNNKTGRMKGAHVKHSSSLDQ